MHRLNHVAAALIILGLGIAIYSIATLKKPEPHMIERNGHKIMFTDEPKETSPEAVLLWCAMMAAGNIILIVDSFRRKYTTTPRVPWFLTLGGIATGFISPLVYYAVWGRLPLVGPDEVYSGRLCRACVAETVEESAGNTLVVNFLYGTALLGQARRCPTCRSVIKTKWLMIGAPLVPMGSYRVAYIASNRYLSRRLPRLHVPHVAWGFGVMGGMVLVAAVIVIASLCGGK